MPSCASVKRFKSNGSSESIMSPVLLMLLSFLCLRMNLARFVCFVCFACFAWYHAGGRQAIAASGAAGNCPRHRTPLAATVRCGVTRCLPRHYGQATGCDIGPRRGASTSPGGNWRNGIQDKVLRRFSEPVMGVCRAGGRFTVLASVTHGGDGRYDRSQYVDAAVSGRSDG